MANLHIDFDNEEMLAQIDLTTHEVGRIFSHVLQDQDVTESCQVSVSLVSDEEMQKINRQWRSVDAPTDVISIECERPGDQDLSNDEIVVLGDIFLSPNYVCAQAERFNTTSAQEATLLLTHALLHLLGYDHEKEAEAKIMEKLEDRLVEELTRISSSPNSPDPI